MKEQSLNTEGLILKAAEEMFLKKGYAATKTTEIAKQAGITHAMLHYYFRTKENLFNIIFQNKVKLMVSSFFSVSNSDMPFLEIIGNTVGRHFDFIRANPILPLFIINEMNNNEKNGKVWKDLALPFFRDVIKTMDTMFAKEIKKGAIRNMEAVDFVLNIISLNIFVFIAQPIIKDLKKMDDSGYEEFLDKRKEENIRLVLLSLQP